jgi:hypothetical protein
VRRNRSIFPALLAAAWITQTREDVGDQVERFINDYLEMNPKK